MLLNENLLKFLGIFSLKITKKKTSKNIQHQEENLLQFFFLFSFFLLQNCFQKNNVDKKVFILLEYSETYQDNFFKKKFEHSYIIEDTIKNKPFFICFFFQTDRERSERDQFFQETCFHNLFQKVIFSYFEEEK